MTGLAILLACIVLLWALTPIEVDWDSYPDDEEGPPNEP